MAKKFLARVHSINSQYITTWNDVTFVSFRKQINGGLGELKLQRAAKFDDFDEGNSVKHKNEVQIFVTDTDTPELKIYSGFIKAYQPWIRGKSEGVNIFCAGYISEFPYLIFKDGTDIGVNHSSVDPGVIARDIIDKMRAEYANMRINRSSSIDNTGTSVSYHYIIKTIKEALDKTIELAPVNWFWYVGADNILHFREKPAVATHEFVFGRDFEELTVFKNMEKVVNNLIFWNGLQVLDDNYISQLYTDSDSIDEFGDRWQRLTDGRITVQGTANELGNAVISANKDEEIKTKVTIIDNNVDTTKGFDIESIEPGDTCKFTNLSEVTSSTFSDNMLVTAVDYFPGFAKLEVEALDFAAARRVNQIRRELETQVYLDGPSSYAT